MGKWKCIRNEIQDRKGVPRGLWLSLGSGGLQAKNSVSINSSRREMMVRDLPLLFVVAVVDRCARRSSFAFGFHGLNCFDRAIEVVIMINGESLVRFA